MISKDQLNTLIQREAKPGHNVLSVYLDTDQREEGNQNRGFLVVLKNMIRDTYEGLKTDAERKQFQANADRVMAFFEDYREPQRGIIICSDVSEDFFWRGELRVNVPNGVWWADTPHLRTLMELMDEHERYTVVLTDRQQARLFTISLGEIEEDYEAFAEGEVKQISAPGQERAWAQDKIQRKADEHAHSLLKEVVQMLSRLSKHQEIKRLILAGPIETTSELESMLPKSLASSLVRSIALPVDAPESRVLEETLKIEAEVERERESDLVERLITAAHKRQKAVLGLDDMLAALQEWRIWQLVYSEGYTTRGAQCTSCAALLAKDNEPCSYCGGSVRPVTDLVALANRRVMEMDGKIELVRAQASRRLQDGGSIGALLRF